MEVDEEKKNDASEVADKDNIFEYDNAAQYSDEEKDCQLDELPFHEEIYQQEEMSGYTGSKMEKSLGISLLLQSYKEMTAIYPCILEI